MKLTADIPGVFPTLQGDGIWMGLPMTFVRTHGCDYHCPWCDTKPSWRDGSSYIEMDVRSVEERVRSFGLPNVAITGGNPLVQAEEVAALLDELFDYNCLIETQASIYVPEVFLAPALKLVSLGPKLHDWRWDVLFSILYCVMNRRMESKYDNVQTQIKVVATTEDEARQILTNFERLYHELGEQSWLHYIIVPEYGKGREGVKMVHSILSEWTKNVGCPTVRLVPQVHKLALYVE